MGFLIANSGVCTCIEGNARETCYLYGWGIILNYLDSFLVLFYNF